MYMFVIGSLGIVFADEDTLGMNANGNEEIRVCRHYLARETLRLSESTYV